MSKMKKVVLVNTYRSSYLPLGLLYIGTALDRNGFGVKIVDINKEKRFLTSVLEYCKDSSFVGMHTVMSREIFKVLQIAEMLKKEYPHLPIVLGGSYATLAPEQACEDPLCDVAVMDEGEEACVELVQSNFEQDKLAKIKGICFKRDGKIIKTAQREPLDLEKLPYPNYGLLDIEKYIYLDRKHLYYHVIRRQFPKAKRFITIYSGRGCNFRCAFCYISNPTVDTRWRGKSAKRLADEIEDVIKRFDIDTVEFTDNDFFTDGKRVFEFLDEVERRGLKFNWYANVRADLFNDSYISVSLLKRMRNLGLGWLFCGVESGSNRVINKVLKKHFTTREVMTAVKYSLKARVTLLCNFILKLPDEKRWESLKTILFIIKLLRYPHVMINGFKPYRPYPNTPLFFESVRLGYQPPTSLRELVESGGDKLFIQDTPLEQSFINLFRRLFLKGRTVSDAK